MKLGGKSQAELTGLTKCFHANNKWQMQGSFDRYCTMEAGGWKGMHCLNKNKQHFFFYILFL